MLKRTAVMCLSTLVFCLPALAATASLDELISAIRKRDFAKTRQMVNADPSLINAEDQTGDTPLDEALSKTRFTAEDNQILELLSKDNKRFEEIYKLVEDKYKGKTPPREVDYSKLWTNGIELFFVGESHAPSKGAHKEIYSILDLAKEIGITHYATEFQSSDQQGIIDSYLSGQLSYEKLTSTKSISNRDYEIIKKAKELGLKVVALDLPSKLRMAKGPAAKINERNDHWALLLKKAIKENGKQTKILVYCGAGHSGYNIYNPDDKNEKTRTYSVPEKLSPSYKSYSLDVEDFYKVIGYAADRLGVGAKDIVISAKNDRQRDNILHYDMILQIAVPSEAKSSPIMHQDMSLSAEYQNLKKECENGDKISCNKQADWARVNGYEQIAETLYRDLCSRGGAGSNACLCLSYMEISRGVTTTISFACEKERNMKMPGQSVGKACACIDTKDLDKECAYLKYECELTSAY